MKTNSGNFEIDTQIIIPDFIFVAVVASITSDKLTRMWKEFDYSIGCVTCNKEFPHRVLDVGVVKTSRITLPFNVCFIIYKVGQRN